MALQSGQPLVLAGQSKPVPTWSPGQPAPPGYTVSADGQSLIDASTGQAVVSAPNVNGSQSNLQNPDGGSLVGNAILSPGTAIGSGIIDLSQGKYDRLPGDAAYGYTGGIAGNNDGPTQGGLITPKTIGMAGTAIGNDVGGIKASATNIAKQIATGAGGLLSGAPDPSSDMLDQLATGGVNSQAELDAIRRQAEGSPTQAPQANLVQLDQTNIDPLRQRQGVALDALTAAANGTVPSAAELAGKDAANRAAAQAYGNAAALQGGQSSGGALRQALDAQTTLQGNANTQMLIDRANEQAVARGQLVQGIGNAQQQEGTLATTNANLNQATNLANQTADVNTRSQDIGREQNLIGGANASANTAEAAAKAALDAKVQEQANANALKGAEISGGASIVGKIASDRRAKTDIRRADLVQLADDAPGYTFDYKDPANGPGRRVGVMAQDVARSRMGKQLVQLGNDDELELDVPNSVGAALAMSAQALREATAARRGR